jgi:hypothetical protein
MNDSALLKARIAVLEAEREELIHSAQTLLDGLVALAPHAARTSLLLGSL